MYLCTGQAVNAFLYDFVCMNFNIYEFVYIYLYVKNYMNLVFGIVYNMQVRHGGLDNNKV
jgi:hypothetical protein